ncbi:uncharacterized protein [Clytia hemisphaerica]|uniref:Fanconi anemia group F protein n=1 Tax=Clytia hemisphaerica TaxID=252671 RepID=A0A7M5X591_9CNID
MNDIVKNTELFISIMGMSRTSSVQKWDHEAFQRAFRWAHYFEQVYKKTRSKPNIMEKISKQLDMLCSEVDVKCGLQPIRYEDLPHVSQILRKNLLENPHLNSEFYLELISQLKDPLQQEVTYKKQLQTLSKLKATLQILQLIQKRFESKQEKKDEELKEEDDEDEDECVASDCLHHHGNKKSQITANASLLRKCLLNVIGSDYSAFQRKKYQLHSKLDSMLKHECGLDVLLSALLIEDSDQFENVTKYILEFVEDILVPKWKVNWKDFLQFPLSNLYGLCSEKHPAFCGAYLDTLILCGDRIQELLVKNNYVLLLGKRDKDANEQLCKYFFFLMQSHLSKFAQNDPSLEVKLCSLIQNKIRNTEEIPIDSNVWKRLSVEL